MPAAVVGGFGGGDVELLAGAVEGGAAVAGGCCGADEVLCGRVAAEGVELVGEPLAGGFVAGAWLWWPGRGDAGWRWAAHVGHRGAGVEEVRPCRWVNSSWFVAEVGVGWPIVYLEWVRRRVTVVFVVPGLRVAASRSAQSR